MRRLLIILVVVPLATFLASRMFFGGARLVGFRYVVSVDNRVTDFPNTITQVDGRRVTLNDGRVLLVDDALGKYLACRMSQENRVKINDGTMCMPKPAGYCGFAKPENSQIVTIPIIQKQLKRYAAEEVGQVWPAEHK